MELLDFARGPALAASLAILVSGIAWRLFGIARIPRQPDFSEPRSTATAAGAMRGILSRMLPYREFRSAATFSAANGYVYHIGLALIAFAYWPHIHFIQRLTGISWGPVPEPVFYVAVAITILSLLLALLYRLSDPVQRLLSNFDDYFSWFVVMLPILTGMLAIEHAFRPDAPFPPPGHPTVVAIHLLSVEALLVWLPFGKLAHAFLVFVSRGTTGAAAAHRGTLP